MKEKERASLKKKNLGAFGPQTFKSRSMSSFQKDLEAGKATHLLPVFNAKEKLARGEIKESDIPYMVGDDGDRMVVDGIVDSADLTIRSLTSFPYIATPRFLGWQRPWKEAHAMEEGRRKLQPKREADWFGLEFCLSSCPCSSQEV